MNFFISLFFFFGSYGDATTIEVMTSINKGSSVEVTATVKAENDPKNRRHDNTGGTSIIEVI
jgi:hypothetical protein